jgi:hypothetical protein
MEKSLGVNMKTDVVTCEVPMGGILFLNNCIPHRSLENYSDKTRWSLDLRWQRPDKPNGFYDMKDCILMRTPEDSNVSINFEGVAVLNPQELHIDFDNVKGDPFDTCIHGPWMNRWEITHHNRHTEAMKTASSWRWQAYIDKA